MSNRNPKNLYRIDRPETTLKRRRGNTKSHTREQAIQVIAGALKSSSDVSRTQVKFSEREISAGQFEVLMESAKLWNKLDDLEKAINERPKYSRGE